jgi:hypothetical protein
MSEDISGGPHLSAAFLCEKVLREPDGVLSFIRVVDRFIRPKQLPVGAQILPLQVMAVASFKCGDLPTGHYKIKLRLNRPDPLAPPMIDVENDIFVEGGADHGFAVVSPLVLNLDSEGLYWFDVYFEGRMVTRVPIRVLLVSMPSAGMQPGPPLGA